MLDCLPNCSHFIGPWFRYFWSEIRYCWSGIRYFWSGIRYFWSGIIRYFWQLLIPHWLQALPLGLNLAHAMPTSQLET